jgi:hypothetical protein
MVFPLSSLSSVLCARFEEDTIGTRACVMLKGIVELANIHLYGRYQAVQLVLPSSPFRSRHGVLGNFYIPKV